MYDPSLPVYVHPAHHCLRNSYSPGYLNRPLGISFSGDGRYVPSEDGNISGFGTCGIL